MPGAAKMALARGVGRLSRLRGGGGTSAPGKVLMRLDPGAVGSLARRLGRGSAMVSATNGKTTTTAMAASILEGSGISIVSNQAGANMAGGVATALLDASSAGGRIDGELGLFEVDEMWLSTLAAQIEPRVIVLGNLFRDQLDRYGELESIADSWQAVLAASPATLVLNADDPLIADLGRDRSGVVYFGVEDDGMRLDGLAHASDAKHCRRCGSPYAFDAVYLGHLGHYHCTGCDRVRPEPSIVASDIRLQGVRSARFTLRTPEGSAEVALEVPGLYNVYNALAAAALASALGIPLERIAAGLAATRAAFGRAEAVSLALPGGRRELRILLIKNPAGANEVLRTLALEPGTHDILGVLNDRIADGRDVSWIWDADFELIADRINRVTCAGTRASDLATRLKYAGVDPSAIHVRPDLGEALRESSESGADAGRPLYALPTYTAMLQLSQRLVARGEAESAWS